MSTTAYDTVVDAARTGVRAINEHLPLDRLPLDRLPDRSALDRLPLDRLGEPIERLHDVNWPEVSWPEIALDDVIDDVAVTVRRHPAATVAIVLAAVAATCGVFWLVSRSRRRRADAEPDLARAGVA